MTRTRLAAVTATATAAFALAGCSTPTAVEVQRDHTEASQAATAALHDALQPIAGVTDEAGRSVRDSCRTGQHNWKIDDPYDVICTVTVYRAFTVTADSFPAAAELVAATMPGCPNGTSGTDWILTDYWKPLHGQPTRAFPTPYNADYLPSYPFGCRTHPRPTPETGIMSWSELPVSDWARQGNLPDMGEPCDNPNEQEPCHWEGDSPDTVAATVQDRTGWLIITYATTEYARTP